MGPAVPAIRAGVLAMCGPRAGKAGQGDERSGTPHRFDRQSSSPLAGLNLFAGPSSPGKSPFPGLPRGFDSPSAAYENPTSNRFLDGNKGPSYGGIQQRRRAFS